MSVRIKPNDLHCFKCKSVLAGSTKVYLGLHRDPHKAIPLCVRCAILTCFRCGKPGIP